MQKHHKVQQSNVTVRKPVIADTVNVTVATNILSMFDIAVIVGADIDFLVFLTLLGNHKRNMFFTKSGGECNREKFYSSQRYFIPLYLQWMLYDLFFI